MDSDQNEANGKPIICHSHPLDSLDVEDVEENVLESSLENVSNGLVFGGSGFTISSNGFASIFGSSLITGKLLLS